MGVMHPAPAVDAVTVERGRPAKASRRKLWEIHNRYMCSVVGTCLSVKEIRKLALRDELCNPTIGDYDLHGLIVGMCRVRSRTSRSIQKILERRYRGAVRRFSKARTEEVLLKLWAEGVERGDVAGPLWALLTHPFGTLHAFEVAFGDVHMLSHALGATRRIDQKDYDKLTVALAQERARSEQLRRAVKERDDVLEAAEARATQQEAAMQQLEARMADGRSRLELQRQLRVQQGETEALLAAVEREAAHRDDAQRCSRRLEAEVERLRGELRRVEGERDAAAEEADAAEAHLLDLLRGDAGAETPSSLHGVHVLYIGGRTSLVPHYRQVVERGGGRFTHHDGGLEQSCAHLERLISGASLVVCPTDAISHSSWLRVKKACRHRTLSFLPVRTSSMASLVSALRRGVRDQVEPRVRHDA